MFSKFHIIVKYTVVSKSEMSSVHRSRERMVIAIIEFVTLRCHSGVSHYDIGIIVQFKVNLMSGKRTLEYRQLAIVVKSIASCVSSSLLAFLGKHTKQLFTLLRIKGMVVIYQAENCAHINRPPHW